MIRRPSILVLVCLALFSVAGLGVIAPTGAIAAGTLGAKVGKPLQEAQQLAKAGDMKGALAKAKEAQAVTPKTPYEAYVVNEFLAYVYTNQRDYKNAIVALEASLKSGQAPASERPKRIKTLAQLSFQVKDCARTTTYANQLSGDADLKILVANCFYIQRNYQQAMATSKAIIDAADAAGKAPSKSALAVFLSSAYQLGDSASIKRALFRMVELYPSDAYWAALIKQVSGAGLGDYARLNLQRLQLKRGMYKTGDEYFNTAKLAFALNLPGDAQAIMKQGFDNKLLGSAPGERDQRLQKVVNDAVVKDKASLAADDAAATAGKVGDADILVGQRYASYGQYAKGAAAITRGLAKPGVAAPDQARLDLGRIYQAAGQSEQARKAFQSIKTDQSAKDVARLMQIAG